MEAHTEQQIIIREVTHIQPSWAERSAESRELSPCS
jgi:hypothetical protein